jgi:hypothetical protein
MKVVAAFDTDAKTAGLLGGKSPVGDCTETCKSVKENSEVG